MEEAIVIKRQYLDIISVFYQYSCKVLPEVRRQLKIVQAKEELCISPFDIQNGNDLQKNIPDHIDLQMLSCCLFALFPGTELKGIISFILSLHALKNLLWNYRKKRDTVEETDIRTLYSCLACAADPSRSGTCAIIHSVRNSSQCAKQPTCLSDQCRLQLAILPSFKQAAPKIKKYMQLYIDLQSYRHYPASVSTEALKNWCGSYLMRYPEISEWEFCASADSFLGIAAMYAAASTPGITAEEITLLDEACFPWLSGLCSLLDETIHIRMNGNSEGLNFISYYKNMKECEERILFFAEKAEKACLKLKESSLYIRLLKTMTALYLTDPEAEFGMLRLATTNILKKSSSPAYILPCRLMRLFRLI